MSKLPLGFYQREDVLLVSKELLGKYLFTNMDNVLTGGIIVETEAYAGPIDRASHAYGNRRTERTEVMFQAGGVSYVYLCYGIHRLFNVITNIAGIPHAVLIRAIQPVSGIEKMLDRRNKNRLDRDVAGGPGSLTKALGITTDHNGISLQGTMIWIEDHGDSYPDIIASPRVGVDYAGEDAELPWRFRLANNEWTSKAK
jgi:DNA-3-methyladenine glycosylase